MDMLPEIREEGRNGIVIRGTCDPSFAALRDAFVANFRERGEIGAAVSVYRDGEKRVDLWGGWRDAARTLAWQEDTLCSVYSISKSLCALSMHILIDRGLIDLEAPVAIYWPEFAQGSKGDIRVRHVLSHHCGAIFNDRAKPGDIYNWEAMVAAIAAQEPAWPAGSRGAYNSVNFGFIQGEIVRRVDGRRVDVLLYEEVSHRLGAQIRYGGPDADL